MRKYWPLALALVCLAVGWFGHRPAPGVRYRTVTVTKEQIIQGEPRVEVRFRDRIVYRTVQPEQVATAPQAAVTDVARFCAPSIRTALADTTAPEPPPELLLRSLTYDGHDLELWGPVSNGDLWRGSYRVHAPLTARVDGDSAIVRGQRLWWVKPAAKGVVLVGIGALIGAVAH